jgi:hypothetical protein
MQAGHGVTVARAEVEEPMGAFGDFPTPPDLDHGELRRVKGNAILAGQTPAWRRP